MKQLSIILPIYNVEPYVEEALDSIVQQQVWHDGGCELIVVNDGSTDGSADIVQRFKEQYPQIIYIEQENGGLGAARNRGLEEAQGQYILFVDSDDSLYPDALAEVLALALSEEPEILTFLTFSYFESGKSKRYNPTLPPPQPHTGIEVMGGYNIWGGVWSYLFSRSFLQQHHLRMPVGIYHEDELFLTQAFYAAQRVMGCEIPLYRYRVRSNTIMTTASSEHGTRRVSDIMYVIEAIVQLCHDHRDEEGVEAAFTHKLAYLSVEVLRVLIRYRCQQLLITTTMTRLHTLGLYPLPTPKYSLRYRVFRGLLGSPLRFNITRSVDTLLHRM